MCLKEAPRDDMEVKVEVPCDVSNVETAQGASKGATNLKLCQDDPH